MYKDPERQKEYQREWVAARRAKYVSLHGGKCEKCDSTELLEFDHRLPHTKIDHRIWTWAEGRIQAELRKCQLICRVCHEAKTADEMDYPDREHGTNTMYTNGKCRCGPCRAAHRKVNARYK